MRYDPLIHHRKSIRLNGYDYTQPGGYFVTIVAINRADIFGGITDGEMHLDECGEIARAEWLKTACIRPEIALDEFVIMPNHIHAIVIIMESENGFIDGEGTHETVESGYGDVGAHGRAPLRRSARSLGSLIAGYKSITAKRINQIRGTPGASVWQRNYYEHIIRDDNDLSRIREYIRQQSHPMGTGYGKSMKRENGFVGATGRSPLRPYRVRRARDYPARFSPTPTSSDAITVP